MHDYLDTRQRHSQLFETGLVLLDNVFAM